MANVALASNGSVVTGANVGGGPGTFYDITWSNDGTPRYDGTPFHCAVMVTPGSIVVTFNGTYDITDITLWFSNGDARTSDPGGSEASTGASHAVDFTIDKWTGSAWSNITTVTGNTLLTRSFSYTSFPTTKIRFESTADGGNGFVGLQEIEATGTLATTIVTGDGNSAGTSTATGGTPEGVGTAAGTSTAVAYSGAIAGTAAGTSTALAVGIAAMMAEGTSVGRSHAHGHKVVGTVYADNQLFVTGSMPAGTTVVGAYWDGAEWTALANALYWNGSAYVPLALTNGSAPELLFYPPTHQGYHFNLDLTYDQFVFRVTIPTTRWVAGVAVSEDGVGTGYITNVITFPSPSGTTYPSTFPWDDGGGYTINADGTSVRTYVKTALHHGGGNSYPFTDTFQSEKYYYTNQIDVFLDTSGASATNPQLWALGFLVFGQTYTATDVATANITANIQIHHVVYGVSTANATSSVSGSEVQTEISTANATSSVSSQTDTTLVLVSTANATSSVEGNHTLLLSSTADVTSSVLNTPTVATYVSTANITSTVSLLVTKYETLVSTANVTSSVVGVKSMTLSSTADVTSSVSGSVLTPSGLVSTANITSNVDGSHGVISWGGTAESVSYANISSFVSGNVYAHSTYVSTADIRSYVLLPGLPGGLAALWCNPITGAAVSWGGTPFESVIEVDGVVYGAGIGGIYKMETALEEGVEINAYVTWDLLDFGDPRKHRPGDFMIDGTASAPLKVTVANEQGRYDYLTHLPSNTKPTNFRARLGKGLNSRHLRFTVANTKSKEFWFDAAEIEVIELARHIGGRHG